MNFLDDKNVINRTKCGECSRCGDCCGLFIPFNDSDVDAIKKYVKAHNIKPANRLNVMTGGFEARCCFYDKTNKKCLIYPVRPYVCKDFMCDRLDWKKRRDLYESKAKYNSTKNRIILATFDDMIYNDYKPILLYLKGYCEMNNKEFDTLKLMQMLKVLNREDILNLIKEVEEE